MSRKSYDQFCGLSRALDAVGERWTLLIVRELMAGPKRYSDLTGVLVGIGTSLLATRLKQLEADGIVDRRYLGPPAASTVYELTSVGQELADAMVPLAIWGARHRVSDGPEPSDEFHAEWSLLFLTRLIGPEALAGVTLAVDFVIGDDTARLRVRDGAAEVEHVDPGVAADVRVTTDAATMAAVAGGRRSVSEAISDGAVTVEGDVKALLPLVEALDSELAR